MSTAAIAALVGMALVALLSAIIGALGVRFARSTSDFLVASRTVGPAANAGAISGEYLSAASFLGIAGLILRDGVDALWYPVGYTAGYLALVLFVAAPLRRSGAYTLPDFAEARLRSPALRRVCTAFVLLIGWLYLLPQLEGAGLTLAVVTNLPAWTGAVAAMVVVVATVVLGGMRSITFVQAFQYWFKFSALLIPAVIALTAFLGTGHTFDRPAPPAFPDRTSVQVHTDVVLEVTASTPLVASGRVDGIDRPGAPLVWEPGRHSVTAPATLTFDGGLPVPVVAGAPVNDAAWLEPFPEGREYGLLATYSLIIATFLGTMGLPHVLVRFYTNPDGRAARRTAVIVLALLGGFYVTVTLLGASQPALHPAVAGERRHRRRGAAAARGRARQRLGRCAARGGRGGGGVGGVPVDVVGVDREHLRRAVDGRVRIGPPARLPHRRGGGRCRAARAVADGEPARLLRGRGAGVRGGGVDVLPAAGAGHLVARAHRARGHRRGPDRGAAVGRRGGREPDRLGRGGLARACCSTGPRSSASRPRSSR